jgi:hypothetical protein
MSCVCISGHELVWHGFVDAVFSSHGIPVMVNAVMEKEEYFPKKRKLDEEDGKDFKMFVPELSLNGLIHPFSPKCCFQFYDRNILSVCHFSPYTTIFQ